MNYPYLLAINIPTNLVNLLITGLIVGILVGAILPGRGFGKLGNVLLGILGAIVGTFVYNTFLTGALPQWSHTLNLTEILIALGGALLLAFLFRIIARGKGSNH